MWTGPVTLVAAPPENEKYSHTDLPTISRAGIEHAGYDGRVEFGHIAFQNRSAIGERNPSERVGVLDGDFLSRKSALACSLDVDLDGPGAILVLVALWAITGRARILHRRKIVRQRDNGTITFGKRRNEIDH